MKKILSFITAFIFVLMLSSCAGDVKPELSADEALDIALEQAGVTRADIRDLENNLDTENGVLVYEIDFEAGNTEYSYDVNATTGEITERDRDIQD